jgi:recombination protein RecA
VTDKNHFLLLQPETLEQGFKLMVKFAHAGVDLIVVDSVGAGVPEAMYKKEAGEQGGVGLLARQWSQFLPLFKKVIASSNTAVIGISQLRESIGGMPGFGAGPTKKPQGGQAWTFYSTLKIMLTVIGKDKGKEWDGLQNKMIETVKGNIVKAALDKCKVSDSYKHEAQFYLMSGKGVDNERTVIDLAIATNILVKKGAWFSWMGPEGEVRGQGLEGFRSNLPEGWLDFMFAQVKPYLTSKKGEEGGATTALSGAVGGALELGDEADDAMEELDALFGGEDEE